MDNQKFVDLLYSIYYKAEQEYQQVAEIAHSCTEENDDLYDAAFKDGYRTACFEAYKTIREQSKLM